MIRELRNPHCTDYGPDRSEKHPEHFFCGECERCDQEKHDKCVKRDSRRCSCIANHTSWDHPTQKKSEWCGFCKDDKNKPDEEESDDEEQTDDAMEVEESSQQNVKESRGTGSFAAKTLAWRSKTERELIRAQQEIKTLQNERDKLKRCMRHLESKLEKQENEKIKIKLDSLQSGITHAMSDTVSTYFQRHG